MQEGLTEVVTPFLKQKGWHSEPSSFVTWWRRTHFENSMIDALCDRGHTPYRQIGHRAVSYVMDRCGISYTQEDVSWLVSEIEKLKPFPEVIAALEKLKSAGYKLTILSNGDRDMLRPPDHTSAFRSIMSFRCRRLVISSRIGKPMRKPRRSLVATAPASCLLPITPSTALVQNPTACALRLLTAANVHSAKHRISLISLSPISPSWLPR